MNTESEQPDGDAPTDARVYCMRCRARRPLQRAQRTVLRNGRPVLKGHCPECQGPLFRIGIRLRRPS